MAIGSVPVDLFNPGQVFACLGLMELAELLHGEVEAGFDWSEPETRFHLRVAGDDGPVASALSFLAEAEVFALTIEASGLDMEGWEVPCNFAERGASFPIPLPAKPANLPAVLQTGSASMTLSSWGDGRQPGILTAGLDNVKFWAGSKGKPGACFLLEALDSVRDRIGCSVENPFALSSPQSGSFRFDWRRDYIPIDIGFSLNNHKNHRKMTPIGYPLVEVLAAIGLRHARPLREIKLRYHYGVVGRSDAEASVFLPPAFVRAALGAAELPFPIRRFAMSLDWPGQENQARCITTVSEET